MRKTEQIRETAERLSAARREVDAADRRLRKATAERDKVQGELLDLMRSVDLYRTRTEGGEIIERRVSRRLEILDRSRALPWAIQNGAVTINMTAVNKIVRDNPPEIPHGSQFVDEEYISIRKPKLTKPSNAQSV
jgi:hypothetical protein